MNIEELAFKNYYELINIQKIDLLLIIEFLQKDRKQWIDQFTQTHNESVEIQKENKQLKEENQELKKQLKNYKKLGFKHLQDKNNDLETQQKEFITYLEDEIKNTQIKWGNKLTEKGYIDIAMTVRAYQIILQKYEEIIGDDK